MEPNPDIDRLIHAAPVVVLSMMTLHSESDTSRPLGQSVEAWETGCLVVYFDGSCPLCSVEIGHYERQRGSDHLCFVDVSDVNAETGPDLKPTTAMRRFHVRQPDGQLLSGARAFVAIWQLLPFWRPAARFAALPGAITVLEIAYRLFLPLRPMLSRAAAALGARARRAGKG